VDGGGENVKGQDMERCSIARWTDGCAEEGEAAAMLKNDLEGRGKVIKARRGRKKSNVSFLKGARFMEKRKLRGTSLFTDLSIRQRECPKDARKTSH